MAEDDKLNHRMRELWKQYFPQQLSRLDTVSRAIESLQADDLNSDLRSQAAADAHKLAGSLGTFGLHTASKIAQEIEFALSASGAIQGGEVARLAASVACIRREIEKVSQT